MRNAATIGVRRPGNRDTDSTRRDSPAVDFGVGGRNGISARLVGIKRIGISDRRRATRVPINYLIA